VSREGYKAVSAPHNPTHSWLRYKRVNIIIPHHSHYSEKSWQTAIKHEQPEEMDTYGS